MTKSKPSLRNSAKCGLLLSLPLLAFLVFGCSSSTAPTYLREDITQAIEDTSQKEYRIEIKAKLVGDTLWIYIPAEDIFTPLDKNDKPTKYLERFAIEQNIESLENGVFKLDYNIKNVPEQEKFQQIKTNEAVFKKINGVLMVLRRVLFSTERVKYAEPVFFCIVAADIKNGFEMRQLSYYLDLKKVSYGLIGVEEYQHRMIQDINIEPKAVGDKEGLYIEYKDIALGDFITAQIQQRIKLKFSKPEVDKNADIDKEIMKIVAYTIKIYGFKDFDAVELSNLLTNNKTSLNRAAIWAKPTE
jgi:hypothetical protein